MARLDGGPVVCPFRRVTGRRCPACGLTRSTARTLHADLEGAFRLHPLGPLVVTLLGACAITGRNDLGSALATRVRAALQHPAWRIALVGAAAVWTVARLAE